MGDKEFELFAKNKFMEIVKGFEKLHPEYNYFELTSFPSTETISIRYKEGGILREITFGLGEETE